MRMFNKAFDYIINKIADRLAESPAMTAIVAKHIDEGKLSEQVSKLSFFQEAVSKHLQEYEDRYGNKFAYTVADHLAVEVTSDSMFLRSVVNELDMDDIAERVHGCMDIDTDAIVDNMRQSIGEAFVEHVQNFSL